MKRKISAKFFRKSIKHYSFGQMLIAGLLATSLASASVGGAFAAASLQTANSETVATPQATLAPTPTPQVQLDVDLSPLEWKDDDIKLNATPAPDVTVVMDLSGSQQTLGVDLYALSLNDAGEEVRTALTDVEVEVKIVCESLSVLSDKDHKTGHQSSVIGAISKYPLNTSTGSMQLKDIDPGTYTISVSAAEGYQMPVAQRVTVKEKISYEQVDVDINQSNPELDKEDQENVAPPAPTPTPAPTATPKPLPTATPLPNGPAVSYVQIKEGTVALQQEVYLSSANTLWKASNGNSYLYYKDGSKSPYKATTAQAADGQVYIASATWDQAMANTAEWRPVSTVAAGVSSLSAFVSLFRTATQNGVKNTFIPLTQQGDETTSEPTEENTPEPTTENPQTTTPTTDVPGEESPSPSPEESETPSPSPSDSETPSPSPEESETPSPSPEESETPSPSPEESQTPSPSPEESETPSPSPEESQTPSPSPEESQTPAPTPTASPTPSPTLEPTAIPTATPPAQTELSFSDAGFKVAQSLFKLDAVTTAHLQYIYSGWQNIGGNRYYYDPATSQPVTGSQVINGTTYLFDMNGVLSDDILGIDVSKYQPNIDWNKVKAAGIDFVIIRMGYRGWGTGAIVQDSWFDAHIKGAQAAGLRVGIYFFSQAVNAEEGREEASACLKAISGYHLQYPIYIDSEYSGSGQGRADFISKDARTDAVVAFCETVKNAGHTPGIYASESWFSTHLYYSSISSYNIWNANWGTSQGMNCDLWQYTNRGSVDGVPTLVDMNISYMG